jgi:hypothetical protein
MIVLICGEFVVDDLLYQLIGGKRLGGCQLARAQKEKAKKKKNPGDGSLESRCRCFIQKSSRAT